MVKDEQGNNLVLYICAGSPTKTVIAVFHKKPDGQYDLVNVKRFNDKSVETTGSGSGSSDTVEEGDEIELEDENEGDSNGDSGRHTYSWKKSVKTDL